MPPETPDTPDNSEWMNLLSKIYTITKNHASNIIAAIKTYKSEKELLRKIGHQDIKENDKKFILSLPDDDLQNLCKRIARKAKLYQLDADSARRHPKERADPEVERIKLIIERINSVLRFISYNRNGIDVEYAQTNYLIPNN